MYSTSLDIITLSDVQNTYDYVLDVGMDNEVEYNDSGNHRYYYSPHKVTNFTDELNSILVNCDCPNCSLDDNGNCLVGINITTDQPVNSVELGITNLQIGICQMKGQACTVNTETGANGVCYDYSGDDTLNCLPTCDDTGGVDTDCSNRDINKPFCCDMSRDDSLGVCAEDLGDCPSACGSIGSDCCYLNKCPTSGACLCTETADEPQCVDPDTAKYRMFNISAINRTNTIYYTYENSTGQLNSCCLSPDNTSCRGWLNISAT